MKKKFIYSILSLVVIANTTFAQTYYERQLQWADIHNAWQIVQKPDGGYMAACGVYSNNLQQWRSYAANIDSLGNLLDTYCLIPDNFEGTLNDIVLINDSTYVAAGMAAEPISSFSSLWQSYLMEVKLHNNNATADVVDYYVGNDTIFNRSNTCVATPDNGLLLGGYIAYIYPQPPGTTYPPPRKKLYLIKLNSEREVLWDSIYQMNAYEWNSQVVDLLPASYHTFYVAGTVDENDTEGHGKMFLMKIDSTGVPLWKREYSTPLGISTARCITRTIDGGLLFVGSIPNPWNYPESTTIIHRLSIGGGLLWSKTFEDYLKGGIATRVIALSDGSFVFTGSDYPIPNNAFDIGGFILKTDAQGNLLWKRSYGGSDDEYLYDMIANHGDLSGLSGYVICGRTASGLPAGRADMYLLKTNCMGLLTEPQASFATTIDTAALTAAFQNLSQFVYPDSIDGGHFVWDFGDGTTSAEINPTHTYAQSGSYEVTLTAVVCSDTSVFVQNICIGTLEQPAPSFVYSLQNDTLVSFTNTSSNAEDAVFIWDFGDGTFSSDTNPTHAYTQAGEHEVRLSVVLCQDTTVFVQQVSTFVVGVPQIGVAEFRVYPNPAQDYLVVENHSSEQNASFVLYDVVGRAVLQQSVSTQNNISTQHLPSGVYLYHFLNPQKQILTYGKISIVHRP